MSFQDKVMNMFASMKSRVRPWLRVWRPGIRRFDKTWPSIRLSY